MTGPFDPMGGPRSRREDPDTSREAGAAQAPQLSARMNAVLEFVSGFGSAGTTDQALVENFRGPESSFRKRRSDLTRLGLIVDSGRRQQLATGRYAVVWVAAEHAPAPSDG